MREKAPAVNRTAGGFLVALCMISIIVGVDVVFLRGKPWVRLATNVGIVAVFFAGYYVLVLLN